MGLEAVSHISDLVTTNPLSSDLRSQGDDHIRNIKTALRTDFPNVDRPQYFPRSTNKTANYTILSTEMEKLFTGNATGGSFSFTLPTLGVNDDGWAVEVVKTDSSANTVTVVGTVNGDTNHVLQKQYQGCGFVWTGTAWLAFPKAWTLGGAVAFPELILGRGTTAQRPTPVEGMLRYNTDLDVIEWYNAATATWTQPNQSTPVAGAAKNLVIKVASNTTATVAADQVIMTNGTLFLSGVVSSTVNLGTTGVDALDTGTIAIDQWYYLWAIAQANGTTKVIASLRSTADATFLSNLAAIASGVYTYYARLGAIQTIHASATLYGTWQFGRSAQYIIGLAQTGATLPAISTVGNASTMTAFALARFIPTAVAAKISLILAGFTGVGAYVAMNAGPAFGAAGGMLMGVTAQAGVQVTTTGTGLLESTNIYYGSSGGASLWVLGWEDTN